MLRRLRRVKLAPPKSSVDDAMRSVLHGSGQGGVAVGDLDEPPSLAETLNQSPAPGVNRSGLELLSDPKGVDFKPYLIRVLAAVRKNWFVIIPESARMGRKRSIALGTPQIVMMATPLLHTRITAQSRWERWCWALSRGRTGVGPAPP